ncbi:MAG: Cys-tRNA(Pro) deacylase [Oscillospiraceae bacterium]|nr:Cys-tRNA(Pro) deacylase [Oscillospiraceae bacterium]
MRRHRFGRISLKQQKGSASDKEATGSKTNVIRILEQNGIEHDSYFYGNGEPASGTEVADMLGEDPDMVFKTLVTQGHSGEHYVFMVPVRCELDLKKAASAVGEKSIAMIKAKELLPLTGYVHGGCSPIGMKKQFRTVADETATLFDVIMFSGGRIGCQVKMSPSDLEKLIPLTYSDITV